MPVDGRRAKTPIQVSSAVLSAVPPSTRPATSLQSSKTMTNLKLIVFILSFAAYGLLPSVDADANGKFSFRFNVTFPLDQLDAISVDDLPSLVPAARKMICTAKLIKVFFTYSSLENITESEFTQLCKNFTVVNKCYANAGSGLGTNDWSDGLERMYGRIYECNKPIFKTALRLCKLTYEEAMDTRNCYDNAVMQFSGSADEAACRQKCCHDPSTFDASEPMLCGPGRHFMTSSSCSDPVLDQTLKDNACQTSCAMDAMTRYARNFCSYDALPVFMAYGKETLIKYLTMEKCFETCPSFGY